MEQATGFPVRVRHQIRRWFGPCPEMFRHIEQMSPMMTSCIFLQGAGNGMDWPLMEIPGTGVSGPPLTSPKWELQAVEVTKVEPVTQNFLPTFSVMPCVRVCHLLLFGGGGCSCYNRKYINADMQHANRLKMLSKECDDLLTQNNWPCFTARCGIRACNAIHVYVQPKKNNSNADVQSVKMFI